MLASGTATHCGKFLRRFLVYFVLCLLITVAATAAKNDQPVVEVFLPPIVNGANTELAFQYARTVVSQTYAEIGVHIVWRSTASAPSGCWQEPLRRKIVVDFRSTNPAGLTKEALAFSNPYSDEGPCVTLLMDRIRPSAEANPSTTGFLLGHVLAHEMGHVLQRIARHSDTGVMKERWSWGEIMYMRMGRLHFTVYDTELIMIALKRNTTWRR
jgi:hypothetical protein